MRLRVGLIGLGDAWERRHRPALRALSDRFEVRAVCEEVAQRAELVAGEFKASTVDGFRALASREDVDAVLMLAPQWFGALPIMAACEAGKAVYCASAFDLTVDQARDLKERVESSGVAFMAEFPNRHTPATIRLKELIATRLGEPHLVFCHHRREPPKTNGRVRRGKQRNPSQELLELVDWCRYVIAKDPIAVYGVDHVRGDESAGKKKKSYRMMSIEFGSPDRPALAHVSFSDYLAWPEASAFRAPSALQVCCEHGVAFVDPPATVIWFDEAGRHLESLELERPVGEQMLGQFHRAVTSLVQNRTDLEDAYRASATLTAAAQSGLDGRKIPVQF